MFISKIKTCFTFQKEYETHKNEITQQRFKIFVTFEVIIICVFPFKLFQYIKCCLKQCTYAYNHFECNVVNIKY